MNPALTDQISELPSKSKAELLALWAQNFNQPSTPLMRKTLMIPILAYRIQEREHGGLSHGARRKLQEIAAQLATRAKFGCQGGAGPWHPPGTNLEGRAPRGICIGARLHVPGQVVQ